MRRESETAHWCAVSLSLHQVLDRVDSAVMGTRSFTRRHFTIAAGALLAGSGIRPVWAADEPYVVDVSWLKTRMASDPNVVILDASAISTYRHRHVPGAVHCWWQDTMELNNAIYGTTLSTGGTAARVQFLQDLGIDNTTATVAYSDDNGRSAARLVWFLRWLGLPAAMLEGGLDAWTSAGNAVQSGSNHAVKRGVPEISAHSSLLLETERLRDRLAAGKSLLLDVRNQDEAHDDVNGFSRIGRIPGSIPFPWTNAVENGRLKPAIELKAALTQAGVTPARPVILYARYGFEADLAWVALRWLGYADAAVYDLGFVGWQASPNRPVDPLPAS